MKSVMKRDGLTTPIQLSGCEEGVETITTTPSRDYTAKDALILENPAPGPTFDLMTPTSDILKHGFLDGHPTSSCSLIKSYF